MRGVSVVLGAMLAADATAQDVAFAELRRWHWQSPAVLCAANDASGSSVAYAIGNRDDGWQLVLSDPAARRETARWPLAWQPMDLRWPEPGVVDVRGRDSDRLLSWSHWHHVRTADGQEFGEPVNYRIADEDPVAHRRMKAEASGEVGEDPHVYRNPAGGLSWAQAGNAHAITDASVCELVLTPDGRYVVLWLPTRVVVVPVAGGDGKQLLLRADEVLAIAAGGNGDEVLVVGAGVVHLVRCSTGTTVRSVQLPSVAAPVAQAKPRLPGRAARPDAVAWGASIQPGGRRLALADGSGRIVDLDAGTVTPLEGEVRRVAWSPDGRTLFACSGLRFSGFDEGGRVLWQSEQRARDPLEEKYGVLLWPADWSLLAIGGGEAVCCRDGLSVRYSDQVADGGPQVVGHRLRGRLADGRWVATRDAALLLCDAQTWQPQRSADAGAVVAAVAVSPASGRVAAIVGGDVVVLEMSRATDARR